MQTSYDIVSPERPLLIAGTSLESVRHSFQFCKQTGSFLFSHLSDYCPKSDL
jgi:hypothetical protein